ncbi:MFS transporter [Pandoraea fibrosis]|uniref:MFS transporter n=1 Tax=Pandoraea fibrosis TaxID=1891094 RepID=A0A5E4W4Q9_9BURK|nr:MFS transporter [Pandoraea fibrosis]QHE90458.1 MFS transporter [Pandoraea fibrosis]QHF11290.1 MFS transporter [Pandoraea fibrosis]VVE18240.1 MFS transporter [Pandoraea fibrosis]
MEQVLTGVGGSDAVNAEKAVRTVALASLIGTTVEWYDFFLYGTVTGLVFNKLFFPSGDAFVATALAYTVYAVGFATRPLGGILFGHFGDRLGRKPLLIVTLTIMGVSTFLIGLVPTYDSIGIAAPLILLFLRLLQGIGLGGEWGGAVLMAFEYAPRGKRGQFAAYPQIGLAVGLCLSTGVVALLSSTLTDAQFMAWGWRLAFMLSLVLVAVGMFIRLRVLETPEFARIKDSQRVAHVPLSEIARDYRRNVLLGWGARYIDGVVFNVYAVFAISYLVGTLHFPKTPILLAVTFAALVLVVTIPYASKLSDRVGRRRVFGWGALACGVSSIPALAVMHYSSNVWWVSLAVIVPLGVVYAFVYGPEASMFCELFDTRVRYTGISVVYQVSGIVSSSITPLVAATLLEYGGHRPWWIAVYVLVVGCLSAACASAMKRTY